MRPFPLLEKRQVNSCLKNEQRRCIESVINENDTKLSDAATSERWKHRQTVIGTKAPANACKHAQLIVTVLPSALQKTFV